MPDPLRGIRVLDFGRFIAGPFCAALLADLGADVIRVEKVRGGEDRHLVPVTEAGDGAFYLQVNGGKRGMTLNPRAPEGRHVLRRPVATADGTLAALLVRRDTGRGQHVRGSLLASALTIANGALLEQAVLRPGRVATPRNGT